MGSLQKTHQGAGVFPFATPAHQDMIPNTEVLKSAQTTSVEASLIKAQLRWTSHVLRAKDGRLPEDLLFGELKIGSRSIGGQRKRFKDTLECSLTVCKIDTTGSPLLLHRTGHNGEAPCKTDPTCLKMRASPLPRKKEKEKKCNAIVITIGTGHHQSHVYSGGATLGRAK